MSFKKGDKVRVITHEYDTTPDGNPNTGYGFGVEGTITGFLNNRSYGKQVIVELADEPGVYVELDTHQHREKGLTMDEPLYEQVKRSTGIDPDKIITDGIARANVETGKHAGAYAEDMETTTETVTEAATELETPGRTLIRSDRCDSCRAEAKGYATKDGTELLFCGHHLHKHDAALREQGFEVFEVTVELPKEHVPAF